MAAARLFGATVGAAGGPQADRLPCAHQRRSVGSYRLGRHRIPASIEIRCIQFPTVCPQR